MTLYITIINIIMYDIRLNNIVVCGILHMLIKRDLLIIFLRPSNKHFVTLDVFPQRADCRPLWQGS